MYDQFHFLFARRETPTICLMAAILAISHSATGGEPLGYFADVRKLDELDIGNWHDELGSVRADGLELYFTSKSDSDTKLFVSRRDSIDQPFGPREPVGITESRAHRPQLTPDGLTLTFQQFESPTQLWKAERDSLDSEWGEPSPIAAGVENARDGFLTADRLRLIYREFGQPDDSDLFMATRDDPDLPFHTTTRFAEISVANRQDFGPTMPLSEKFLVFTRGGSDYHFGRLHIATRDLIDEPFGRSTDLDRYSLGRTSPRDIRHEDAETVNRNGANWFPSISPDWPADGSKLYYTGANDGNAYSIYEATWHQATPSAGDLTSDGTLDIEDLEILEKAVRFQVNAPGFDVNLDGDINSMDRQYWITDLASTWIGDSNLDGEFNSTDFVQVFESNEYEDDVEGNSTWSTGDWNADGEFDSSDFVVAFQDGGYEKGPKPAAVPEPAMDFALFPLIFLLMRCRLTR